jgi:hypothetical protein
MRRWTAFCLLSVFIDEIRATSRRQSAVNVAVEAARPKYTFCCAASEKTLLLIMVAPSLLEMDGVGRSLAIAILHDDEYLFRCSVTVRYRT